MGNLVLYNNYPINLTCLKHAKSLPKSSHFHGKAQSIGYFLRPITRVIFRLEISENHARQYIQAGNVIRSDVGYHVSLIIEALP